MCLILKLFLKRIYFVTKLTFYTLFSCRLSISYEGDPKLRMSGKYKHYENLTLRQKKKCLCLLRNTVPPDSEDSDSSLNEGLEDNESSVNDAVQVPVPLESEDGSTNSDEEGSSTGSDETMSSNEEDIHVAIDGHIDDEHFTEESDENSEVDNQDVNVFQDPVHLKKTILKNVFLAADLKHKQGNLLLRSLREYPFNLTFLPKDTRTLLHTPTVVASNFIQNIAGGEYLHIGFRRTFVKKLESLPTLPENVEIDLSTDGAKVDKSVDQFWPVQFRIANIRDKRPMIAGIFKGKHKPSNPFEFFEQLIQEIVEIQEQGGISVGNNLLPVNIRCFIADAPARAFALNHYGHTSSHAVLSVRLKGIVAPYQGLRAQ